MVDLNAISNEVDERFDDLEERVKDYGDLIRVQTEILDSHKKMLIETDALTLKNKIAMDNCKDSVTETQEHLVILQAEVIRLKNRVQYGGYCCRGCIVS